MSEKSGSHERSRKLGWDVELHDTPNTLGMVKVSHSHGMYI